ncbi:MAG: hypothetical protein ABI680_04260 [Chthoniobacteraceae bacterium]
MDSRTQPKEPPAFVRDADGQIRWGIRREGSGKLPPTMIEAPEPPTDPGARRQLVGEALFAPDHWNSLPPTSDGCPDVSTYLTLQFYLEVRPAADP